MKVGDLVKEKFGGLWREGVVISRGNKWGPHYITILFNNGQIGSGRECAYYLLKAA